MRKIISPGHAALAALFLGSAMTIAACVPAPMDAEANKSGGSTGSSSGGSTGSSGGSSGSSGGSSGSGPSSSGGSTGSSGGSTGSSGGSSGSSSGGSSGAKGGSTGSSGGSSGSSGGSSGSSGGASGGSPDMGGGSPAAATFTQVYDMIIKPSCAGMACHGAAAGKGGLRYADKMVAYMTLKAKAGIIKAGDPAGSKLVTEITPVGGKAKMPAGAGAMPLSTDKIDMIKAWIMAGANDN
jgi:hypothetical protein